MSDKNASSHIKLHQIGTINIHDVIQNHNTFLNYGHTATQSDECHALITILGGMDNILKHFLIENNPYNLDTNQVKQINDIFSTKSNNINKKMVVYSNQLTSFEEVEVAKDTSINLEGN